MLKSIHIENYKSLKKISLPIENMTLFLGMNGMGKSSIIQAILLCRQSYWRSGKNNIEQLVINGDLVSLGTAEDIFCVNADYEGIVFKFLCKDNKKCAVRYSYDYKNTHANSMMIDSTVCDVDVSIPIFSENFVYLSAEHIGPRIKYDYSRWDNSGISKFGIHGEYVVPYLAMNGDTFLVPEELCLSRAKTRLLIDQVSAWMDAISAGVHFSVDLFSAYQEAKLSISYEDSRMISKGYSPINVGFGIPYVLPIVVALLTSSPGTLILLENPESHLHPKGQSTMAVLMARVASYGVQIICESHSDHIINGLRVAIKEGVIDNTITAVSFFSKDENHNSKVNNISIDSHGNLDSYPQGLLDEWGDLMSRLI